MPIRQWNMTMQCYSLISFSNFLGVASKKACGAKICLFISKCVLCHWFMWQPCNVNSMPPTLAYSDIALLLMLKWYWLRIQYIIKLNIIVTNITYINWTALAGGNHFFIFSNCTNPWTAVTGMAKKSVNNATAMPTPILWNA